MIKGKPCKVLSISVSKTGKHGHAKCNFTAVDIFTGKKLEDMVPSSHGTTVPIVTRTEWEIIDIGEEGELTLMDEGGNQKTDVLAPIGALCRACLRVAIGRRGGVRWRQ